MSLPVVCGRNPVFFFELNVKILTGSHADHGIYFTDADILFHIGGIRIDMVCCLKGDFGSINQLAAALG